MTNIIKMINKNIIWCFIFSFIFSFNSFGQETFPVNDVKNNFYPIYAFTNATIYMNPETKIEQATLIIKHDKILAVGQDLTIPEDAIIKNLNGKYIYPSFIDLYSNYGVKEKIITSKKTNPKYISNIDGSYGWNESIKPYINANEIFKSNKEEAEKLRDYGFGSVLTHNTDGIFRGSGTLVTLSNNKENLTTILNKASNHLSLNKGKSKQIYPRSLMGTIALIKQSFLDAEWYKKGGDKEEYNITLESINKLSNLPQIIETNNKLDILRVSKIAEEFEIDFIIKGNGDEYQRIQELKKMQLKYIIPVNFPNAYKIEDVYDEEKISLSKLKHWEFAPYNLSLLKKEKMSFCITSYGSKTKEDFYSHLKMSINDDFMEKDLLAALTTIPAKFINAENILGSIEKNKIANFLIVSNNIFENGIIEENWIQGKKYIVNNPDKKYLIGKYILQLEEDKLELFINDTKNGEIVINDSTNEKIKIKINEHNISFVVKINMQYFRFFGVLDTIGNIKILGDYKDENGDIHKWTAFKKQNQNKKNNIKISENDFNEKIWFPNKAYGWKNLPELKNIYFQNATIWTNEEEGIINNANLIIYNSKILYVGISEPEEKILKDKNFTIINLKGKHITSGIIDEHSHIAISRGVNEGSQAVTAEVSIGDVINSEDINIYRQLSGGVTTSQLLHGSANPIGGQSAIIKLKWGFSPEDLKFPNADKFIKFALGENVKQSNWGDDEKYRFPQSRMGVEQIFYDAFLRAKEYDKKLKDYNSLPYKMKRKITPPREDLELIALLEILNKNRFITCHSYVQSEINMLMKVADSMNFNINTFTHVLEGYKIADKLKAHGAGASTFSDWWAYKFEVNDAIPYNAALLNKMGVLTAINSDDAEMGRRLNQEAAKAIKYGGLTEEEAWKLITLNPAKLLHIDNKVGSIKNGKDADIVIWNHNPLSVYSKVEQTYIDGICFFDHENDKILREKNKKEKNRIIQKMLKDKSKDKEKPKFKKQKLYHCDTLEP